MFIEYCVFDILYICLLSIVYLIYYIYVYLYTETRQRKNRTTQINICSKLI